MLVCQEGSVKSDGETSAGLADDVNSSATFRRAAFAHDFRYFFVEAVINRQLLAALDVAHAHVENVPFQDAGAEIRIAGVIDVFSTRPPGSAVNRPISVEREQVSELAHLRAAAGFAAADAFAGILDDFSPSRNELSRINTPPVNFRGGKFHFEAGEGWIDMRDNFACHFRKSGWRSRHEEIVTELLSFLLQHIY